MVPHTRPGRKAHPDAGPPRSYVPPRPKGPHHHEGRHSRFRRHQHRRRTHRRDPRRTRRRHPRPRPRVPGVLRRPEAVPGAVRRSCRPHRTRCAHPPQPPRPPRPWRLTAAARLVDRALPAWDRATASFEGHSTTRDGSPPLIRPWRSRRGRSTPPAGVTPASFRGIDELESLVDSLYRALKLLEALQKTPERTPKRRSCRQGPNAPPSTRSVHACSTVAMTSRTGRLAKV